MSNRLTRRRFLKVGSRLALGVSIFPSVFSLAAMKSKRNYPHAFKAAYTMGTIMTIEVFGEERYECERAIDEALREVKKIDRLMSVFNEKSQLSLVNQKAGESEVRVDERLIEVLKASLFYNKVTGGAFDITIEPLMELWGFRERRRARKPTDRELYDCVKAVGCQNIILDAKNSKVWLLQEKSRVDLGGIAVGYSVDRAVKILQKHGIESALINHSGDIYALGTPPEEQDWLVEITDPLHPDETITSVKIRDKAVSTSGNYQNYMAYDGGQYGHILNPRTGKAASHILSATVIADTSIEADALSTGIFVMGLEKGKTIVNSMKGLDLIGVTEHEGREEVVSTVE